MNRRLFSIVLFASLAFGCAPKEREGDKDKEKGEVSTIISKVRLKTNKGDIVIQLNAEKAPVTVANFKKYVSAGHYNGTVFHRVINEFMIQGGGYENKDGKLVEKKTGEGIVNESNNGLKNDIGTIAMARTNDPNSATAQFFINVVNNDGLNFPNYGGYAVFGKVIEGMKVVNEIKVVNTAVKEMVNLDPRSDKHLPSPSQDVPVDMVIIESATLE
jgi:cyclophilin family peptidyl-prolyl cis-trans isomerase